MKVMFVGLLVWLSAIAPDQVMSASLLFSDAEIQRLHDLKQQSPKNRQSDEVVHDYLSYDAFIVSNAGNISVWVDGQLCEQACVIKGVKIQPRLLEADGALLVMLGQQRLRLYPGEALDVIRGQVVPIF